MNDTVKIDLATGKISDFIEFDTGVIAMVTGGRNVRFIGSYCADALVDYYRWAVSVSLFTESAMMVASTLFTSYVPHDFR